MCCSGAVPSSEVLARSEEEEEEDDEEEEEEEVRRKSVSKYSPSVSHDEEEEEVKVEDLNEEEEEEKEEEEEEEKENEEEEWEGFETAGTGSFKDSWRTEGTERSSVSWGTQWGEVKTQHSPRSLSSSSSLPTSPTSSTHPKKAMKLTKHGSNAQNKTRSHSTQQRSETSSNLHESLKGRMSEEDIERLEMQLRWSKQEQDFFADMEPDIPSISHPPPPPGPVKNSPLSPSLPSSLQFQPQPQQDAEVSP